MPLNPMMSNCKNTKNRERDNSFSAVYASVIASETIALERIISGLVLQVLRGGRDRRGNCGDVPDDGENMDGNMSTSLRQRVGDIYIYI